MSVFKKYGDVLRIELRPASRQSVGPRLADRALNAPERNDVGFHGGMRGEDNTVLCKVIDLCGSM